MIERLMHAAELTRSVRRITRSAIGELASRDPKVRIPTLI